MGYSLAGDEARSRREVVGCGERIVGEAVSETGEVGESITTVVGTGWAVVGLIFLTLGPVRMLDGRICSKPCWRATFSMDLKYWIVLSVDYAPRDQDLVGRAGSP